MRKSYLGYRPIYTKRFRISQPPFHATVGVAGALLLLVTPARVFSGIVPWLPLFSTVLLAAGPTIARRTSAASHWGVGMARWREPGLLAASVYSGYFMSALFFARTT